MNEWTTDSLPANGNNIVEGSTVAPSGNIHFATVSTTPTVFPALSYFLLKLLFYTPLFPLTFLFVLYVFTYDMIPLV